MQSKNLTERELREVAEWRVTTGRASTRGAALGALRESATVRFDYARATYSGPIYLIFGTLQELVEDGPEVLVRKSDGSLGRAQDFVKTVKQPAARRCRSYHVAH